MAANASISCGPTGPTTAKFIKEMKPEETAALVIGTCLTAITVALFLLELWKKYNAEMLPEQRKYVLWLLSLYPILSLTALASVWAPLTAPLTDLFNTLYFSISLVKFWDLIILYFGGRDNMQHTLGGKEFSIRIPPFLCLCFCIPNFKVSVKTLRVLRVCVQQFIFVPPALVYMSELLSKEESTQSVSIYLQVIRMLSAMMAMKAIIIFLRIVMKILTHHQIKKKFAVMKLALLFGHVQIIFLKALGTFHVIGCDKVWSSEYRANWINNNLLCSEMLLLSLIASWCYRDECASEIFELMPVKGSVDSLQVRRSPEEIIQSA